MSIPGWNCLQFVCRSLHVGSSLALHSVGSFVGGWASTEMDARFHAVFHTYKDCPDGCIVLGPHFS
jgi:hypothetical protein